MPRYLTMKQIDAKAQELGSVGEALQWARDNGYTVDTSTELPPLPGQQPVYEQPTGGLAQAGAPDVQNDLNTAEEEDGADLGVLAGQDIDFSKLNDPVMFGNLYRQTLAQQQAYEKSAAERFEAAKARLNQRYAGPSQADQLFSLSRALLSPRKTPGFAGTLQQVVGSFDDVSKAQRQAQIAREEQLAALQEQYEQGRYQRGAAGTKNITDMLKTYSALNKPVKARTGFNPLTGKLVDMDTGLPVTPPLPRIGEVRDGYRYLGGDPASQKSWKKV